METHRPSGRSITHSPLGTAMMDRWKARIEQLRADAISDAVHEWRAEVRGAKSALSPEWAALELRLIERARETTVEQPPDGAAAILGLLLPRCLRPFGESERERARDGSDRREELARWLSEMPELPGNAIRTVVVRRLVRELRKVRPVEGALWTAAVVGYRDRYLQRELWRLSRRGGLKAGPELAMRVLATLGPRPRIAEALHLRIVARAEAGWTKHLVAALHFLAMPESLSVLAAHPGFPLRASEDVDYIPGLLMSVAARIAIAYDGVAEIQQRAWEVLERLVTHEPYAMPWRGFAMRSDLSAACDTDGVLPSLLRVALRELDLRNQQLSHAWYVALLRVKESHLPHHVSSWENVETRKLAVLTLRGAITRPSGSSGDESSTTEGMRHKELAWDLLVRSGDVDLDGLLEDALANEANGFVRSHILKRAAGWYEGEIPPTVLQLLQLELPEAAPSNAMLFAQVEAVHLARHIISWDSFRGLLTTGINFQAKASRDVVMALREVTIGLTRAGEGAKVLASLASRLPVDTPIDAVQLASGTAQIARPWHRAACVLALSNLVGEELAPPSAGALLVAVFEYLAQHEPDSYELSEVIAAVPDLRDDALRQKIVPRLVPLVFRNGRVGWRAAEALIRLRQLERYPDALAATLKRGEDTFAGGDAAALDTADWRDYCLGLLYRQQPELYAAEVVRSLAASHWTGNRVTDFITGPGTSREVVDMLITVIQRDAQSSRADFGVIAALSRVAPRRLASELTSGGAEWLPEARAFALRSLADAVQKDEWRESRKIVVLCLDACGGDESPVVRLTVFDELRMIAPDVLRRRAETNARSIHQPSRVRAAEMAPFLAGSDGDKLLQSLSSDREPSVREAAERGQRDRRRRRACREAFSRLQDAMHTNAERASIVRFTDVLEELGDTGDARRLRVFALTLPAARDQLWLTGVANEISERERRDAKRDRVHWAPDFSVVSKGRGVLTWDGQTAPVRYTAWYAQARNLSGVNNWGAAIHPVEQEGALIGAVLRNNANGPMQLVLEDGRHGDVLIRYADLESAILAGSGPLRQGLHGAASNSERGAR